MSNLVEILMTNFLARRLKYHLMDYNIELHIFDTFAE